MNMTPQVSTDVLISQLKQSAGQNNVLVEPAKIKPYCKGFRFGFGEALAVVTPDSLVRFWWVIKQCVAADTIIIIQAANTGLTGGSTPDGTYDRRVIIINTMKMDAIQILNGGKQVVALPGSRLYELEKALEPYQREPHSVIGSSCIGASIIGGVCNNSGGALIQRGPAYTEMALYARIDENRQVQLINHLGIELGDEPEAMLQALDAQSYSQSAIRYPDRQASDHDYQNQIREVDADTPARFNNDERRLFEVSGCAGKLIVFAVRLDTFAKADKEQVFYIGVNDQDTLARIRRRILTSFNHLPVSGEYMHKDYFDVADKYGKDSFLAIQRLGSHRMPKLFALKNRVDAFFGRWPFMPKHVADKLLQGLSRLFPDHLPKRMREYREIYQHHLVLQMADDGITEARDFLQQFFTSYEGDFFECSEDEGKRAFLHRFVMGGAAKRYKIMNKDFGDIMALDVALRRNESQWFEKLPPQLDYLFEAKLYCGHFMCHVMHQDYIVKFGVDADEVKAKLLAFFDERGAQYPAEHNVGQQYHAKAALRRFYQQNDPTNSLNPGIGQTPKGKDWQVFEGESAY